MLTIFWLLSTVVCIDGMNGTGGEEIIGEDTRVVDGMTAGVAWIVLIV